MPYKVNVLRVGKCIEEGGNESTGVYSVECTITLLEGKHLILVDTGGAWETAVLQSALKKHDVAPELIDYVVGTHGHSDHIGNLNLFPNATHIVAYDINKGPTYTSHTFAGVIGCPYAIDEDVTVEATPGHTAEDVTVFVQSEAYGLVAVTGDLFECFEDLEMPQKWQEHSQFPKQQQMNRLNVVQRADTIIPGHGALFQYAKPKTGRLNSPHIRLIVPVMYKEQPRMLMMETEPQPTKLPKMDDCTSD